MKKILIVNNNMNIGGIQKALVNLLTALSERDDEKYEIDLLLFEKAGELLDDIPVDINVISGNFWTCILGMSNAEARRSGALIHLNRSFWTVLTRIFKTRFTFGCLSRLQRLKDSYDCAISYVQGGRERVFYGGCAEFVLNSVRADKKVYFVHCDFLEYGGNCAYNRRILEKFDSIAAVSASAAGHLRAAVPSISDKVVTVHNCCDFKRIKAMAEEYAAEYTDEKVNLFTAARLHSEKGILRMLPILKSLKNDGLRFVWRVAGDGPDRAETERLIDELELNGEVILLGSLKNPYPYFKKSDVLLVPSYNEAAPMVFNEARAFGTPIFTTDTSSAVEMVKNTHSGVVCENTDKGIETALKEYIRDFVPHKNSAEFIDNSAALEEFDSLITD